MDVVLVGLPGSGKTAVGRVLARRLGTTFVDTDELVEHGAGRSIAELFATEGETAFRDRERAAIAGLGGPSRAADAGLVIGTGGGAVTDPRNRWWLFRGRQVVWLDAPDTVLVARLARDVTPRPLLVDGDAVARLGQLRAARVPFYAAGTQVDAEADPETVAERVLAVVAGPAGAGGRNGGTFLLRSDDGRATFALGDGVAAAAIDGALRQLGARRAVVLSEPAVRLAAADAVATGLERRGWPVERIDLPSGEAAKRLSVVEAVAGDLARRGVERGEPLVAIGGGALTDAAGFVAATYARGVPWIAVPTTLVGQVDAAIGGKTAVDLPGGKNLVGAFHAPSAVVVDVAFLRNLPERERRAALAEAVKTGLLGEPRLLEVLEADGPGIAEGRTTTTEDGSMAEVVERSARFKLDVVAADPHEHGDRVALNLGHTLGHAIEAAGGFGDVRHGEAVAYGLRAACRIGLERGTLGTARAARAEQVLDTLELGVARLPYSVEAVLAILGADKKRRDGRLRWVLPTDDGWTLDDEVPDALVRRVAESVLAGRSTSAGTGAIAGAAR